MKINLTGLKVSDIIDSSKSTVAEGTAQPPIPRSIDQTPGNPKSTVDTSGTDALGKQSMDTQSQVADASSVQKRKELNPAGKGLEYDKAQLNAADQASPPKNPTDVAKQQPPKQKSFKQSLMDKMLSSQWDKSSSDTPSNNKLDVDSTGPDQGQKQPAHLDQQSTKRPQIGQFDPRNINAPRDPNPPAIDTDGMLSGIKSPNLNMPSIKMPNIRPSFR